MRPIAIAAFFALAVPAAAQNTLTYIPELRTEVDKDCKIVSVSRDALHTLRPGDAFDTLEVTDPCHVDQLVRYVASGGSRRFMRIYKRDGGDFITSLPLHDDASTHAQRLALDFESCKRGDIDACNRAGAPPPRIAAREAPIEKPRERIASPVPLAPPAPAAQPPLPVAQEKTRTTERPSLSPLPINIPLLALLLCLALVPFVIAYRYIPPFQAMVRRKLAFDAIEERWRQLRKLPMELRYKLFPRDTPRALEAMQIAHAYLQEIADEKVVDPEEELAVTSSAARQIRSAEFYDPDAVFTDPETHDTLTVTKLKARTLAFEASARVANEQPNRAARALRTAIRLTPQDAHHHYMLGVVLIQLAEKKEAIATLKTAAQLDPTNIEIKKALDRARHISRAAKAVRDVGERAAMLGTIIRYSLFAGVVWLLYSYLLAPMWTTLHAPVPESHEGLGPLLFGLFTHLAVVALGFLGIVLLLRLFVTQAVIYPAVDLFFNLTNRFRR